MSMVRAATFRLASMREIVDEYRLATQTDPRVNARAVGPLPTGIVATTELPAVSILETVESSAFAIHAAPPPTARAEGPLPTGIVATVSPERRSTSATFPAP